MKRMISIFLAVVCMVTVSACGRAVGAEQSLDEGKMPDGTESKDGEADSKTLVAYFSATGTTRSLAEYAADVLDADLYEIVPVEPYTQADLAYDTNGRADREQSDPTARPEIFGSTLDMSQYNVIFLGYPKMEHGFNCVLCI